jgi:hypothetical protein
MRWAKNVLSMGEREANATFSKENLKERDQFEDLVIDMMIILRVY